MNWKKLLSIGALTMFSASIATGQGTAPTIVQGDYISNVFGNSNFIKNPNAKLNNKDVTVSNATVTRSTTTPLVATSEFLVTVTSANGTIAWNTRTFDQGMKGQNCEARFTYRGFQSTSVAQVRQGATVAGANVVARLALTASTDPRIASINFPCGDLSQPTYFVITDTATLSGTHEIGGAYVGLATNMANVAQAEFVGGVQWQGCNTPEPARTGSTAWGNLSGGGSCSGKLVLGKATSANEADASVTFNNLPPGNYFFQTNTFGYFTGAALSEQVRFRVYEDTSGAQSGTTYLSPQNTTQNIMTPLPTGWYTFTTTANRTFRIQAAINNAANTARVSIGYTGDNQVGNFSLYRFPLSSELVVKPETQNVWGSVSWTNAGTLFQSISTSTYTSGNSTIFGNANATTYGAASATGNTSEITITNMPVGTFRIMYNGSLFANSGGSATNADCSYRIRETSTSTTLAQNSGSGVPGQNSDFTITNIEGVYRNTSVATRTFRVEVAMLAPTTGIVAQRCGFLGQTNTTGASGGAGVGQPTMIVQPLDQPSNSALYVQGPVKAAETGAAISASYVGEVKQASVSSGITASNTRTAVTSIVLTPGVWRVHGVTNIDAAIPGYGDLEVSISPDNTSTATWFNRLANGTLLYPSNAAIGQLTHSAATGPVYVHYDGTNLTYLSGGVKTGSTAGNTIYLKVRTVYTTLYNQWHYMVAERVN